MGSLEHLRGIPYDFKSGPEKKDTYKDGANCQLITRLALEDHFGTTLPAEIRSEEILIDDVLFPPVLPEKDGITPLEEMDIFIFGKRPDEDRKKSHLAVFTGKYSADGQPMLFHGTVVDGTTSEWPLSEFFRHPRYKVLRAIKRFNPTAFTQNQQQD